ncbi:PQQ-binding-like beta-propeller repeat protein [Micromonospora sp. WMMD812]|uniref:outer membrane protein assembly factor BamB family protein n=1 Tax=Micromonospora sp. WMMD812 TaxID=3015152 RepID=UPI00248ABAA9|nr:PQQ-binding-like beta-propeller repeat protein [Micromonospora sp. WMMD812]WBB70251.1 PQQ-binding-like beta-propeller repeat protein [Micromonospora sp. WMMD812]
MTLIDLGDLREDPAPSVASRRPPPLGRPLRTLLVLLLALATLSAAAPPPGRMWAVVPAAPVAEALFAGDLLLVSQLVPGSADGSRDLVAYPLPDRATTAAQRPEPLWQVRLPAAGEIWRVQAGKGVLVLSGSVGLDGTPETTVLDAETGRVRWRLPGFSQLDATGRLLLENMVGATKVSSVDLASGRVLWSIPSPPTPRMQVRVRDGVIDRIVAIGPDGLAEVRDAATGTVLRRADLGLDAKVSEERRHQVVADLLLVVDGSRSRVRAYDLDRLESRWEADLPLMSYLVTCGALLCAQGPAGGIRAVDPATGAARWSAPPAWDGILGARGDRLLVMGGRVAGNAFAVLDAGTGRVVAELGEWQPLPSTDPDGPPVGLRRAADGRLVVVEFDVVAGRVRVLDVVTDTAGHCQVGADAVVCRRLDGSFGVWRWRR